MKRTIILLLFSLYITILGNPLISVPIISYNEIVDKPLYSRNQIIRAIIREESSDGKFLYSWNKKENAVGVLQIRPIMVKHINQDILGFEGFTLADRLDSLKSVYMFMIYERKHNPKMNFEIACRIWNGGPNGMKKEKTIAYFDKIKIHIKSIK